MYSRWKSTLTIFLSLHSRTFNKSKMAYFFHYFINLLIMSGQNLSATAVYNTVLDFADLVLPFIANWKVVFPVIHYHIASSIHCAIFDPLFQTTLTSWLLSWKVQTENQKAGIIKNEFLHLIYAICILFQNVEGVSNYEFAPLCWLEDMAHIYLKVGFIYLTTDYFIKDVKILNGEAVCLNFDNPKVWGSYQVIILGNFNHYNN